MPVDAIHDDYTAIGTVELFPGEHITAALDFSKRLKPGQTLTGTPTVVLNAADEYGDASLITVSDIAINVAPFTMHDHSVAPVGTVVVFKLNVGSDTPSGTEYAVTVTTSTASNPVIIDRCRLRIL